MFFFIKFAFMHESDRNAYAKVVFSPYNHTINIYIRIILVYSP
jgi:hypothetical protein